jgi:hypothetical protein
MICVNFHKEMMAFQDQYISTGFVEKVSIPGQNSRTNQIAQLLK